MISQAGNWSLQLVTFCFRHAEKRGGGGSGQRKGAKSAENASLRSS